MSNATMEWIESKHPDLAAMETGAAFLEALRRSPDPLGDIIAAVEDHRTQLLYRLMTAVPGGEVTDRIEVAY